MASKHDEAFEAFYERLENKGGIGGHELLRAAWDAGRRYEQETISRPSVERLRAFAEDVRDNWGILTGYELERDAKRALGE